MAAIGVNNADGDNPDVTAKQNYWGNSDGPFVIESNDDDGDVPTPDHGEVDLDSVDASAVTENVVFKPFKRARCNRLRQRLFQSASVLRRVFIFLRIRDGGQLLSVVSHE